MVTITQEDTDYGYGKNDYLYKTSGENFRTHLGPLPLVDHIKIYPDFTDETTVCVRENNPSFFSWFQGHTKSWKGLRSRKGES